MVGLLSCWTFVNMDFLPESSDWGFTTEHSFAHNTSGPYELRATWWYGLIQADNIKFTLTEHTSSIITNDYTIWGRTKIVCVFKNSTSLSDDWVSWVYTIVLQLIWPKWPYFWNGLYLGYTCSCWGHKQQPNRLVYFKLWFSVTQIWTERTQCN